MKSHVWCSSLTQDLKGIRRNNGVPHSNQRQQLFASHSSLLQDGIISRFIKNGMNAERTDTLPADQTHNCILPPASPLQPVLRPGYQRMQKGSISQSPIHSLSNTLTPRHCSWTVLGTHSTNCHPIFSVSARCAPHQLLLPSSVQTCLTPLLPTLHLPPCPTPYQFLEDSQFQA